jgi:hypothetical protein
MVPQPINRVPGSKRASRALLSGILIGANLPIAPTRYRQISRTTKRRGALVSGNAGSNRAPIVRVRTLGIPSGRHGRNRRACRMIEVSWSYQSCHASAARGREGEDRFGHSAICWSTTTRTTTAQQRARLLGRARPICGFRGLFGLVYPVCICMHEAAHLLSEEDPVTVPHPI